MVLCSQLPPNSGNHGAIPDSTPHRHPTRNRSHNHGHRMCICEDVASQKPLNVTIIHTDSDSTPHRHPTRNLSLHHWHRMCICDHRVQSQNRGHRMCTSEERGTGKAGTLKFIHTSWRIESHIYLVSTLLQSHGQVTRNKHPTIPQNTTTVRRDTV